MSNPTVDCLNAAFVADPAAIHSLVLNRVPCNDALADDPFVIVERVKTLSGKHWSVDAIGLINAVLAANKLPLVVWKFDDTKDAEGRHKLSGFCEYIAPVDPPFICR